MNELCVSCKKDLKEVEEGDIITIQDGGKYYDVCYKCYSKYYSLDEYDLNCDGLWSESYAYYN